MNGNIKDYTRGVNDFLHFAEVMNLNAQMDMRKAQDPVMTGMAPQIHAASTPTANGAVLGAATPMANANAIGAGDFKSIGGRKI